MIVLKTYDFFEIEKKIKPFLAKELESGFYPSTRIKDYTFYFRVDKKKREIQVYFLENSAIVVDSFESITIKYKKERKNG